MIRTLRRHLSGWPKAGSWPAPGHYQPKAHRKTFDQAFWLVRLYYAATLVFAYQEMGTVWELTLNGGPLTPLWPVFWASDAATAGPVLLLTLITSALLAVALPDRRWPRILVFLGFLSVSAFRSSFGLGSINHGNHFWLWIGLCFCFLPSGSQSDLGGSLAGRYRFLLVFWFTQGLILLFYSMSGFWKVAAATEALMAGRMSAFHPEGLATAAAWKMIQSGEITFFGPWLAERPWVGWPIHLAVIYAELFAILIWFRPSLHRAFGIALACFHIGTFLLLGISFPKHVLVLTLLFIWSPFIPDGRHGWLAVRSLPGFGYVIDRLGNRGGGEGAKTADAVSRREAGA